jgi:hypothetical protein
MQRIFLTSIVLVAIASNVSGTSLPGQVTFAAGTGETGTINEITYSTDGLTTTPYPVSPGLSTYGVGNIGFFTAADGTILNLVAGLPDFNGLWMPLNITPVAVGSGPSGAGSGFATISLPVPAGNNIELEVVVWSGSYTSWSAAVASGSALIGFSGETFNGSQIGALGWSQPTTTGTPPNLPAALVSGQNGFEGIVLQPITVPEPSTYALSSLAAGLLLICRRLSHRKSPSFAR